MANKLIAALTTSVAGGSGISSASSWTLTYSATGSCSLEPQTGDNSYGEISLSVGVHLGILDIQFGQLKLLALAW